MPSNPYSILDNVPAEGGIISGFVFKPLKRLIAATAATEVSRGVSEGEPTVYCRKDQEPRSVATHRRGLSIHLQLDSDATVVAFIF